MTSSSFLDRGQVSTFPESPSSDGPNRDIYSLLVPVRVTRLYGTVLYPSLRPVPALVLSGVPVVVPPYRLETRSPLTSSDPGDRSSPLHLYVWLYHRNVSSVRRNVPALLSARTDDCP